MQQYDTSALPCCLCFSHVVMFLISVHVLHVSVGLPITNVFRIDSSAHYLHSSPWINAPLQSEPSSSCVHLLSHLHSSCDQLKKNSLRNAVQKPKRWLLFIPTYYVSTCIPAEDAAISLSAPQYRPTSHSARVNISPFI